MPEVNLHHGLPEESPRFYAKTRFWQNGEEFVCVPPFECQKKMDPTHDEVLAHLLEILRHNDYAYWGKDGVSFKKSALKFGELSFKQVAARLADPLSNQPVNGITFEISTRWEEIGEIYHREKHQDL